MRTFSLNYNLSDRWFDKYSPVFWLINQNDNRELSDLISGLSDKERLKFKKFKADFFHSLDKSVPLIERQNLETQLENELYKYNSEFTSDNYFEVKFTTPLLRTIGLLNKGNLRFFHHVKYPFNVLIK